MDKFDLQTAVVFCIFNRLETAKRVFEVIRQAKPPRLYIVSDAARGEVAGEEEKVNIVRRYVEQHVDWPCEVFKNYADHNMGCGKRIPDGIDWAFESEEQLIILEDDCVPELSFFQYCEEMLDFYKEDERILMISGNNPFEEGCDQQHEYLFVKIPFIWGWATWKRAWKLYDFNIKSFPENKKNRIFKEVFPIRAYWAYMAEFETVYNQKFDAWDYQWLYTCIVNNKLGVAPTENHVYNIGICEDSTHTNRVPQWMSRDAKPVKFPIKYRDEVVWDRAFEREYFKIANKHGFIVRIKQLLGLDINKSIFSGTRKG